MYIEKKACPVYNRDTPKTLHVKRENVRRTEEGMLSDGPKLRRAKGRPQNKASTANGVADRRRSLHLTRRYEHATSERTEKPEKRSGKQKRSSEYQSFCSSRIKRGRRLFDSTFSHIWIKLNTIHSFLLLSLLFIYLFFCSPVQRQN